MWAHPINQVAAPNLRVLHLLRPLPAHQLLVVLIAFAVNYAIVVDFEIATFENFHDCAPVILPGVAERVIFRCQSTMAANRIAHNLVAFKVVFVVCRSLVVVSY